MCLVKTKLSGSSPFQYIAQTVGWGPHTALFTVLPPTFPSLSLISLLLLWPAMWSPLKQPLWNWVLTWGWWRCKWWKRERRPPGTAGPPPLLQTSTHCRRPQPGPGPGTAGLCMTPPPRCAGSLVGGCWCPYPLHLRFPGLQHCQLLQVVQPRHWGCRGHVPLVLPRSR